MGYGYRNMSADELKGLHHGDQLRRRGLQSHAVRRRCLALHQVQDHLPGAYRVEELG